MGEITDALRRARQSGAGSLPGPRPAPDGSERAPLPPGLARGEAEKREREVARETEPGRRAALSADKHGIWTPRVVVVDGHSAAAESCRHVALRLRRELSARRMRSCAVVSALRQEGKTTLACNLALALAFFGQGRSVALVDLDLRNPTVGKCLELPREAGIEQAIRGERSLCEVCISIDRPGLDVYPVHTAQRDPQELLAAPGLAAALRELDQSYEIVLIDTPPVLLVPDAAVILGHVGAAVAVARAGRTMRKAFESMRELLPAGRLLGSILNEGELPTREGHYGYYGEENEGSAG
jgi:capsular exopolysaccharide synthesis family protein